MSDAKTKVECKYCGVEYTVKHEDGTQPIYCCFCGEYDEQEQEEIEDDLEDYDIDNE